MMRIAITADLHLREEGYRERSSALEGLLEALTKEAITTVFIAGDLFDRESQNYGFFDKVAKRYNEMEFFIIPGNHDHALEQRHFTARNIHVFNMPQVIELEGVGFVFLPFRHGMGMDDLLAEFFNKDPSLSDRWVLVGHGDYLTGRRPPNAYEPGIYMPITSQAIERYRPEKVVLGHIHKPLWRGELGKVYYPGSLCGLDINETGPRGYISLELPGLEIQWHKLPTEVIYFNETLPVLPEDSPEDIIRRLEEIIDGWPIEEEDIEKVSLRLQITGYCWDKRLVVDKVQEFISRRGINLYDGGAVTDRLYHITEDPFNEERLALLKEMKRVIGSISQMRFDGIEISRKELLLKTMELIFQQR